MLATLCLITGLISLSPAVADRPVTDRPVNGGADRPFVTFSDAAAWVRTTAGEVVRNRVLPHRIGRGQDFWYRIATGPGAAEFVLVRPESGERRPAFDHAVVAGALSRRGARVTAGTLPFRSLDFPEGPDGPVRFSAEDARWEVDGARVRRLEPGAGPDGVAGGSKTVNVERLTRPRPSWNGGEPTVITFKNRTDGPIGLFWRTGAEEKPYGTIPAGGERERGTFAGHVWVIRDADGRALTAFVGAGDRGTAIIAGPDPDFSEEPREIPSAPPPPAVRFEGGDVVQVASGRRLTDVSAEPVPEGYRSVSYRGPALPSPDGRTVAVLRVTSAPVRKIRIAPNGDGDGSDGEAVEPFVIGYPKPGDLRDLVTPVFFDAATGARIDLATDLLDDPYSAGRWRWAADGSELFFLFNPRGHQYLQVLAADPQTGAVRIVVDERSDTFVDYSQKTELHWLPAEEDGPETLLWASERSGWNHLYRIDAGTGDVRNAVTSGSEYGGDWVVREVVKIEDGRVWFVAGGIVPGQDPYYRHLCRVDLDGSNLTVLTSDAREPGDGTHEWEFLPGDRFLLDRFSRVDLPPVTVLRDAETGALVCELERADAAARLATGWRPPVRFTAKGRDGMTDIHGLVIFPPGFDPAAAPPGSLPVLENIYAGPHGAFVEKAWGTSRHARELAALGFAVVRCDGMGTNWRSKAFHDICWRDLADSGFPDRILFIKALAKAYPALEVNRVGVYGGSAGGQSAMRALLSHHDFYSAAAADCGCHDNRVDKLWWNEAWLGRPSDDGGRHYDRSSNVRDAARLEGDLLLTLGGSDRNVDPACTYDTADALRAAGKQFDLIVYPKAGHGAGELAPARRQRAEFFLRTLTSRQPADGSDR